MPDQRLPLTQEELRDWLALAWEDGWGASRQMVGKPMGTIIVEHPQRLQAFLQSWDLPPLPDPPHVPLREAIRSLCEKDPS